MKIFISPFPDLNSTDDTKQHTEGFWKKIIKTLKLHHEIIQIGITGDPILTFDYHFDLKIQELDELIRSEMDLFISADSYFTNFCHIRNKHGILISDQKNNSIFACDRCEYIKDTSVDPFEVIKAVNEFNLVTLK